MYHASGLGISDNIADRACEGISHTCACAQKRAGRPPRLRLLSSDLDIAEPGILAGRKVRRLLSDGPFVRGSRTPQTDARDARRWCVGRRSAGMYVESMNIFRPRLAQRARAGARRWQCRRGGGGERSVPGWRVDLGADLVEYRGSVADLPDGFTDSGRAMGASLTVHEQWTIV